MLIRSITSFIHVDDSRHYPIEKLKKCGSFSKGAIQQFKMEGFEVQTSRLATNSFAEYLPLNDEEEALQFAKQLELMSVNEGFAYLALGPAMPERMESYRIIPALFQNTDNVFLTGNMFTGSGEISLQAIQACAKIITEISSMIPNGFQNLYFAALAKVPGGTPFFPSAYSDQQKTGFSIACEAADLAVEAFSKANTLAEAKRLYIENLEGEAARLTGIAESLAKEFDQEFLGIDLTPAPFIEIERSVGTALEALGIPSVGLHGSLAACAFLMDAIDQACYKKAGFNGLMLPVLEDAVLAKRVVDGNLTIKDLLMFSAVCGTGLDTVPLPGDVSDEQIAAVLLDVASLSSRLDKPLTARLMPIPGLEAGEETKFDFAFFVNSAAMALDAKPLNGLLGGEGNFRLEPRHRR